MKPTTEKISAKRNGYQSDDDNARYKINTEYFNNVVVKSPVAKQTKKQETVISNDDDNNVRYMFPTVLTKANKPVQKSKQKPKIKVNFWSTKSSVGSRAKESVSKNEKVSRRHTIASTSKDNSPKLKVPIVKVRKRVSFLPSPLFTANHVPMVTVPDDLTIQLNEEEANDLGEDLNQVFVNAHGAKGSGTRKAQMSNTQFSPRGPKRKRSLEESSKTPGNEYELEFFSKYVVQKLRRMETNQRIYSENLVNTVLMLGQLGKLNGKSKIINT